MTCALEIARREFRGMFRVPVGWIALALHLFLTGAVFALLVAVPGRPATMQAVFETGAWLLVPIVPAISMRLLSEEYRTGTWEVLFSSPASDAQIVLGKYLGACGFLGVLAGATTAHVAVLYAIASPAPDWGPIVSGYLLLVLCGSAYLGVGLLASALTSNQTLAFLATLFALVLWLLATTAGVDAAPAWARPALAALSIGARGADFSRGVIDTAHVVFFLSVACAGTALACAAVSARRWR